MWFRARNGSFGPSVFQSFPFAMGTFRFRRIFESWAKCGAWGECLANASNHCCLSRTFHRINRFFGCTMTWSRDPRFCLAYAPTKWCTVHSLANALSFYEFTRFLLCITTVFFFRLIYRVPLLGASKYVEQIFMWEDPTWNADPKWQYWGRMGDFRPGMRCSTCFMRTG